MTETRKIKIFPANNKGFTLATSIILIVFASTAVLSVTTFIIERLSQTEMKHAGTKAFYLARAGINQAIYSYRTTGANAYFTPGTTVIPEGSFILGGTTGSGFDSDLLMVDTNSGSWSSTTYDTIAVRSETTGGTTTSGAGIFTVDKPASVSNNDYLVCVIGKKAINVGVTVAPPVGWTTGDQLGTTAGSDVYGGTFYKKIINAAGEPATYTFDSNGANETFAYWIGSLSGIDQTTPEDVSFSAGIGQWANLSNDSSPNLVSVTTVTPQAFALGAWAINADTATTQPGSPWANRADDAYPATGSAATKMLNVMSQALATAGTGTGTAQLANVSGSAETQRGTFVLRPAAVENQLNYGRIKSVIDTSTRSIRITKMIVSWPANGRVLRCIYIGGAQQWPSGASCNGSANPGTTVTLNNPGVDVNATGLTTNYLNFDGAMGQPTTTVTFIMSDSIGDAGQTVDLWPNTNNFRFTIKASGKKTGSILYRTIEAEYNANTSKVVDHREIATQMQ